MQDFKKYKSVFACVRASGIPPPAPAPKILRLVLWVFLLLLPVSGSENTDVNCGGGCPNAHFNYAMPCALILGSCGVACILWSRDSGL